LTILTALAILSGIAPIVLVLMLSDKLNKLAYNFSIQLESLKREAYIQADRTQSLERSLHALKDQVAFDHGNLQQVVKHLSDDLL
jgi:hypothetical protein